MEDTIIKWIECAEKKPEYSDKVFVTDGKEVGFAYYDVGSWVGGDAYNMDYKITHWAEIPNIEKK